MSRNGTTKNLLNLLNDVTNSVTTKWIFVNKVIERKSYEVARTKHCLVQQGLYKTLFRVQATCIKQPLLLWDWWICSRKMPFDQSKTSTRIDQSRCFFHTTIHGCFNASDAVILLDWSTDNKVFISSWEKKKKKHN